MSENIVVKLNLRNPETAANLKETVSALPGFSISKNGDPCDVMFLEIGADIDEEFRLMEQVRAKGMAREVFLFSSRKDPDLILRALKTGVKEFFPEPINEKEVVASLMSLGKAAGTTRPEKTPVKRGALISVIGSKGGVGATTTAVNLAVCLKERAGDKSVVLMDMNPLLGGVPLFLDMKTSFSWADGAREIARIDSTYLLNTLYKHPAGIHVLPAPARPAGLESTPSDTMERLVGLLRSTFDIIVMDGSKYLDDLSLRMLALSDSILVVSELTLLSVVNASKLLETFDGLGISPGKDIKIVVNRYQKKNMVSAEEAEKTLGKKIISLIPNDYETTMSAINSGKTLSALSMKSEVMDHFKNMAALLLHQEVVKKDKSAFSAIKDNFRELTSRLYKGEDRNGKHAAI